MEPKTIKALLDACYLAKRIRDLLPALPQGVTPAYITYLDVIQTLQQQGRQVKISDISDTLNLPRPGVTRTVKEMEAKGFLCKHASPSDGRITYISVTEAGKQLSQIYNEEYFCRLAPAPERYFPGRRRPHHSDHSKILSCHVGRKRLCWIRKTRILLRAIFSGSCSCSWSPFSAPLFCRRHTERWTCWSWAASDPRPASPPSLREARS